MSKRIELSGKYSGMFFEVSDDQYEEFSKYTWYVGRDGYPFTNIKAHQMALGMNKRDNTVIIDHKNRNRWDCTLENLRVVTHSQNMQNKKRMSNNKTGYKGVVYRSKYTKRPYAVFIGSGVGGRNRYLGCFDNPIDAAKCYDSEARKVYGDYAVLNFPEEL